MMDDYDIETRFVHREETFTDHAIEELAQIRAACMCRLQYGSCSESECQRCSVKQNYDSCVNNMSAYDKSRVRSHIGRYYVLYSSKPESWLTTPGILFRLLRTIFVVGISIALIFGMIYVMFK